MLDRMNRVNLIIKFPEHCFWLLLLFITQAVGADESDLIARIEQLDEAYQQLSNEYFQASTKDSDRVDDINKLVELTTRLKSQQQTVEANRLIYASQQTIENSPDQPGVIQLVELLLGDNERQLAETIYGLIDKTGDEISLANLRFVFAKYHARLNQWLEVTQLLKDIIPQLQGKDADYAYLLQGSAMQYLREHRQSVESYANVATTSPYYIHAQLNTALASIRQGWITEARGIIDSIIPLSSRTENHELTNRIYLVLGYALLQKEYFRDARQAFRNVGLGSRYTNKALMGISLTAISQGDYVGGLNSVSVLKTGQANDLTTDEAYLLLPYIYEKLDQKLSISSSFSEAIHYYQKRLLALDALKRKPVNFDQLQFESQSDDLLLDGMRFNFSQQYPANLIKNYHNLSILISVSNQSKQTKAIEKLLRKYNAILKEVISSLIDQRRKFITSYLNQSRYGLARYYDSEQEPKSKQEIRKAYTQYLNNAVVDENTRLDALTRLAELEYDSGDQINTVNEEHFYQRQQRIIELLSTSITDYPDAKGNDVLLYQLAKAQAQNDQYDESIETLALLSEKYPRSPYYVESQFRIAEDAFSTQSFSAAEYAYNEVIISSGNDIFFEKSLFKRGWSRFKQSFYEEAIADYIEAVLQHNFGVYETLSTGERDQFDEYFRGIALSFTYLNDTERIADFFKGRPDFPYRYQTYQMIGDLYYRQERFSDSVDTHRQFTKHFPDSDDIPYAYLKIIEIWKNSGFKEPIYQAIEDYYQAFSPASSYWVNQNDNSKINRVIRRSLREYIVLMTGYYHNRYQSSNTDNDYQQADKWYRRYLQNYEAYAQQDNLYFLYGELLAQRNKRMEAFTYYELAAFDNEQILHQEASYAAIILSGELYTETSEKKLLDKNILYAKVFSRQFPLDNRAYPVALQSAEQAYQDQRYSNAIELADLAIVSNKNNSVFQPSLIKALSYFNLNDFEEAESLYKNLLLSSELDNNQRQEFRNNLALAIYRQAEQATINEDTARSIYHFARISTIVPESEIAASGLYDAIALNMKFEQWIDAIGLIDRFQNFYPQHQFSNDVSRKLSAAYLNSNQGIKAAREFEKIARTDSNLAIKAAALWQAAQIYEKKNKIELAIKFYAEYTEKFLKPYSQRLEAMAKIAELYAKSKTPGASRSWYEKIIKIDETVLNNVRTDASRNITSTAYLVLARLEKYRFDTLKLTLPLKNSLRKKKTAMQKSIVLFGKSSVNKIYDITTEATYSIGKIYQDFSQSLLNSDRPDNLNEEELDQYEILLEDQAFPFEDKSIEFFEINLSRIQEGLYNDWIRDSFNELIILFPVRYNRQPKQDDYVADME